MTKSKYKRSRKLINRRLQLRLVGACLAITSIALMLQFLLLGFLVTKSASELDGGGGALADQLPAMLLGVLGVTFVLILPAVVLIGIRMTFRFAGPLYRIEQYMLAMSRGEKVGKLSIREDDELHSLCDAINLALGHTSEGAEKDHQDESRTAA